MKSNQKTYWTLALLTLFIGALFPFILKDKENKLSDTISLSATIVSAITGIITLVIAALLYDRFGAKSRFKEMQTGETLKLLNLINSLAFRCESSKYSYYTSLITTNNDSNPILKNDLQKTCLLPEDWGAIFAGIHSLKDSIFISDEIKKFIKRIEIIALVDPVKETGEEFVKIIIGNKSQVNYYTTFPKITLQMLHTSLSDLLDETQKWLKENAEIPYVD